MRRLVLLTAVLLVTPAAWSICDLPPKRQPPDQPPDPPPPPTPPEPDPFPPGPGTGGRPTPVPTPGADTPNPRPYTRPDPRGSNRPRTRGAGTDLSGAWHLWWELNRENLLGLRQTLRRFDVVTGDATATSGILPEAQRARVREALRETAKRTTDTEVRAAALRALGRAGDDTDADLLLRTLRSRRQDDDVLDAAAIALGTLPRLGSAALRDEVCTYYADLLAGRAYLPQRTHDLAVMTLALRASEDPRIAASLADRCAKGVDGTYAAAAVLYACGLTRDRTLLPVLLEAARAGRLGGERIHDIARSHAALALGLMGDGGAVPVLVDLLRSRRVEIDTKRSAAIALGLILRRPDVGEEWRATAEAALLKALRARDPITQGFAATAIGTAAKPFGLERLQQVLEDGDPVVRPFAALALGCTARTLPETEAVAVRTLLHRELGRAEDIQLSAALAIATGLGGAAEAQEHLFARLKKERMNPAVRGPSIQGLGLLGRPSREIEAALVEALEEKSHEVVEDACIALGFLGTRTTSRMLVDKLAATTVDSVRLHMVAALSHLGGGAAVDPLLEVLDRSSAKGDTRAAAASALGILADTRDEDPLFRIDTATNPYCLTSASRELVVVY